MQLHPAYLRGGRRRVPAHQAAGRCRAELGASRAWARDVPPKLLLYQKKGRGRMCELCVCMHPSGGAKVALCPSAAGGIRYDCYFIGITHGASTLRFAPEAFGQSCVQSWISGAFKCIRVSITQRPGQTASLSHQAAAPLACLRTLNALADTMLTAAGRPRASSQRGGCRAPACTCGRARIRAFGAAAPPWCTVCEHSTLGPSAPHRSKLPNPVPMYWHKWPIPK